MQNFFIAISSTLALISPLIYLRAIMRGKARPHRTTRLVLLLIAILTTASLFAQHDRVAIWLAGIAVLQSIPIFILSFKLGMGGWAKSDLICLALALLGIILWKTTDNPTLALYSAIAADFTGMVPAIIKTYRYPKTEVWSFYFLDVIAAGFSILALNSWTLKDASYPIYILFINFSMVLLIRRPNLFKHKITNI